MKTKTIHLPALSGSVKTVNAVACIHKVLDEMAEEGKLNCNLINQPNESTFVFIANGICATFHVQAFAPIQEGGSL